MSATAIKDHGCVDFCQPQEHCDLVHMGYEPTSVVGAHQAIADVYWRGHRVVVTRVERASEFDGEITDTRWTKRPLTASRAETKYAWLVRWRAGIDRPTLAEIKRRYGV